MTKILILCTGNSARSQMAEGLLRALDPGLDVHSAGTSPAERVHPAAVKAMAEIGVDIGNARPKPVEEFAGQAFDYVITVCGNAKETCPVFPGGTRLHVGFRDPAAAMGTDEEVLQAFREVRDGIRARFGEFHDGHIRRRAYEIEPARSGDWEGVLALLARVGLPEDGLAEQFGDGYAVVRGASGIVAVAGVERYGAYGLLRSVAVTPELQGTGLGGRLVEERMRWARSQGLRGVYLLTTTAARYFPKAGFLRLERAEAPEEIRASRQFALACPASAAFMGVTL